MDKNLPKISYCVFTYNEEKNIDSCLKSIFTQDYPKDKLEVILVDDNSLDNTLKKAKKFPVKIFMNGKHDGDLSATIGFKNASGEFFTAIGADMRFRGNDWFRKMIKPFIENPTLPAVFTRYYSHSSESLITKYLNLDSLQRDLVYQTFSINFNEVITEKRNGYYVCKYTKDKIPPQSHGLYRVNAMRKIIEQQKIWYDMGNLVQLVNDGYTTFGYVPNAGYYHFHAENIKQLLQKRIRNIKKSYLRYSEKKSHFKWIDFGDKKDVFKLIVLLLCTNLVLPLIISSAIKSIRYKNWLYILEMPITFLLINTILFTFIKEKRGREMIRKNLLKILHLFI